MKYLLLFILISNLFSTEIKASVELFLIEQFSDSAEINMYTIKLNNNIKNNVENIVKQKFYRDKLYYWNISRNDSTIAYAFLDNVIGKSMPITFLMILNINGVIINTTIIKYREAYGGEVGNKSWLTQFYNKNNNSEYKIGKDIDGITGATLSARSMSKGINKIATLYPFIKKYLK